MPQIVERLRSISIMEKSKKNKLSRKVKITKLIFRKREKLEDRIVREILLVIFINGKEFVTIQCSPDKLEYLTIGFLLFQGFIKEEKDIKK